MTSGGEEPGDSERAGSDGDGEPVAKVKHRTTISPIWLVPIVATGIVAYIAIKALIVDRGPLITITFETGEGLSAHQTEVRHKAVTLGTVDDLSLSKDMSHVTAEVRMTAEAKPILTDHAKFWVVRPRFSGDLARLESGLATIVSGAYIAIDPGTPGGKPKRHFVGLEQPPGIRSDEPGHVFSLETGRLGGIGVGAPVFHDGVAVGEVLSHDAGTGRGPVSIRVFVKAPFDTLVRADTRFWRASGVTLTMGPSGLHFELQSIRSVLSGGVAFEDPPHRKEPGDAVGKPFELYDNKQLAESSFYARVPCVTYFRSSVAGLAAGSEVTIYGVPIGVVMDVHAVEADGGGVSVQVRFDLQPGRALGQRAAEDPQATARALLGRGLSAVISSSNLLTGQKVLALEYVGRKPAEPATEGDVFVVPGEGGGMDDVTRSLGEVAAKLNRIPFDRIGRDVDRTLRAVSNTVSGPELRHALGELAGALSEVRKLARDTDAGLRPALEKIPALADEVQGAAEKVEHALGPAGYGENSDFRRSLMRLVTQASDAARNVRQLAEFLDAHPEALIRGRSAGESQ